MTPDEEIIYLQGMKQYLDRRLQYLRQKQKQRKVESPGYKLSYSGLWVQSDCIAPLIQEHWLDHGHSLAALEAKANIGTGVLSKITNGKTQWTREEFADKILMALDLPHLFNDLPKARVRRQVMPITEPPKSQYWEE